jgi:hypothetical protein
MSDFVVPGSRLVKGFLGLVFLRRLATSGVRRRHGSGCMGLLLLADVAGARKLRMLAALRRLQSLLGFVLLGFVGVARAAIGSDQ